MMKSSFDNVMDKLNKTYIDTIKHIKNTILQSRYRAAVLANKELLTLYLSIGKLISEKVKTEKWGSKVLDNISLDLQSELPGLRGFSSSNLKKMRVFYDSWSSYLSIGSMPLNQIDFADNSHNQISSMPLNQLYDYFIRTGFSSHYLILSQTDNFTERVFYIQASVENNWPVETLRHHLKNKLYINRTNFVSNFSKTIDDLDFCNKALLSFKDEYLLDYINIVDSDEEDERLIENEIVRNIKKFIMSLGSDFTFVGNQYRLTVEEEDFFIDLLFFNRNLQCLVAFELKKGKFKPEYLGKMNFYLSALDEYVKKAHENPSIGIILCKEKNNKIVEFTFKDFNKAMGVSTYKTSSELPERYKNILPNTDVLKKIMDISQ